MTSRPRLEYSGVGPGTRAGPRHLFREYGRVSQNDSSGTQFTTIDIRTHECSCLMSTSRTERGSSPSDHKTKQQR